MLTGKQGLTKFIFSSIGRKLVFAFMVILVFSAVSSYLSITASRSALETAVGENSVFLAQEAMDKIDRSIYSRAEELQAYSLSPVLQEALKKSNQEFEQMENVQAFIDEKDGEWRAASKETITPFMKELIESRLSDNLREKIAFYEKKYGYALYGEIFVTNKFGANVTQTGKTSDYRQDDEGWWQNAKEEGLYVEDLEYDESAGIYSIAICTRIDDRTGAFLGVMKSVLNLQEIIVILNELMPDEEDELEEHAAHGYSTHATMEFKLLTSEAKVIYSTAEAGFEIFEDASDVLAGFKVEEHPCYYISQRDKPGEGERLFAHSLSHGYRDFKGLGWILVVEHETAEIFARIIALQNELVAITLIVLATAILIAFFFSRAISKSVKELHEATEEVEKGNFKKRVDIRTGDEMEQLGNAFNKTTEALEKMDAEHKQLEHAKTEFLSITSHELRSPMTPMKAQLQMLMGEYFGKINPKQKEALNIVLRNTSRLDRIILDFLEISRIEAARLKFKFVKTNLAVPAKRLVEEMKGWMPEKNIGIVTNIGNLPEVEADPDRVMQVLRNLINNAKKFSPNNSKIFVDVKQEGNMIKFSVKDQGIGIKQEDQRRIFEPFFQVEQTMHREKGGTGLGLSIGNGIIESQNGDLWVESEPGKGATFYFTVPFTPVTEIKPIKLLFSPAEDIEKKVEALFIEVLGPIGKTEFDALKNKGLNYDSVAEYFQDITKKGVITAESVRKTNRGLAVIFGAKTRIKTDLPKQLETLYLEYLGQLGNERFKKLGKLSSNKVLADVNELEKAGGLNAREASRFRDQVMGLFRQKSLGGESKKQSLNKVKVYLKQKEAKE